MKKMVFFVLLILTAAFPVAAQQYGLYQSCEAGITFLDHNRNKDKKLPGTLITLSGYSHELEIRTVLPSILDSSERSTFNHSGSGAPLNLKMTVSPDKMQRYITSEKVFTVNGTLQLNNLSKPVSVQYTPFPEGTEDEGQMRISLIVIFNLSDFFSDEFPDEPIAFVINNSFVNRQ